MNYLPLFIETREQRIVVVGTGQMAEAKCRTVLKTRAQITLVTAHPTETMQAWADAGQLTPITSFLQPGRSRGGAFGLCGRRERQH